MYHEKRVLTIDTGSIAKESTARNQNCGPVGSGNLFKRLSRQIEMGLYVVWTERTELGDEPLIIFF